MNKIIFGVIGALVLSISGVSIVSAVGHANESTDLPSRTVTTEESINDDTRDSENADTRLSDDSDEDDATIKTESEQQEVEKRWSSESSFARGEDDDEDEHESEEEDDDDDRSSRRAPVQSTTTPQATSAAGAQTFTMQQVAAHATATSCYTTIGGSVYDLTPFIAQHPGGQSAILSLCGINGAAAFSAQHGGQGNPATELASLKIGTLAQ